MIIEGLFETHLFVQDLAASVPFYSKLGLQQCYFEKERKAAFFG